MVAVEMDGGATLAQALATVATRIGVDPAKIFTDHNKEADPLVKSQLLAQGNNAITTIQAALKNSGSDVKTGMTNAIASKNVDSKVLYIWTQIGASDTSAFTKVSINRKQRHRHRHERRSDGDGNQGSRYDDLYGDRQFGRYSAQRRGALRPRDHARHELPTDHHRRQIAGDERARAGGDPGRYQSEIFHRQQNDAVEE